MRETAPWNLRELVEMLKNYIKIAVKEVGIRKVLGATVPEVVLMLKKELAKWVVVGNAIAWQIAYYAMHSWLDYFEHRTNIGFRIFPLSGGLALIVASLTVGSYAVRAAKANPVESLRYE